MTVTGSSSQLGILLCGAYDMPHYGHLHRVAVCVLTDVQWARRGTASLTMQVMTPSGSALGTTPILHQLTSRCVLLQWRPISIALQC